MGRAAASLLILLLVQFDYGVPSAWAGGAAVRRPIRPDSEAPVFSRVVEDYTRTCEGCHQPDGYGMTGIVPRLKDFAGYFTHVPEGRDFLIRVPGVSMALLDDERITEVMNWVLYALSPGQLPADFQPYTVDEVRRLRANPLAEIRKVRAGIIATLREKGIVPEHDDGLGPRVVR